MSAADALTGLKERLGSGDYWATVLQAVEAEGIGLDMCLPPSLGLSILVPPRRANAGGIVCVSADLPEAPGPDAFSVIAAVVALADAIFLVTCAPLAEVYEAAALHAVAGMRVLLIEGGRDNETAWAEFIVKHYRHGSRVIMALIDPDVETK